MKLSEQSTVTLSIFGAMIGAAVTVAIWISSVSSIANASMKLSENLQSKYEAQIVKAAEREILVIERLTELRTKVDSIEKSMPRK